jgi:hypothetical protein
MTEQWPGTPVSIDDDPTLSPETKAQLNAALLANPDAQGRIAPEGVPEIDISGDMAGAFPGTPVDPVAATGITNDDIADAQVNWTAETAGTGGNAITIEIVDTDEITTELTVTPAVGGNASALKYTAAVGVDINPLSIIYAVGGEETPFAIAHLAGVITVTMETDEDEVCVTTAAELYAAMQTAVGTGGALEGIIASVEKAVPNDWVDATDMEAFAEDFLDSALDVQVDGNAITVYPAYDGETAAITTTGADLITAVEAETSLVAGVADGTGLDAIEADSIQLDNGVNGTVAVKGAMLFDTDKLYIAKDACTTAVSAGWNEITFDAE